MGCCALCGRLLAVVIAVPSSGVSVSGLVHGLVVQRLLVRRLLDAAVPVALGTAVCGGASERRSGMSAWRIWRQ